MSNDKSVMVFIEQHDKKISAVSYELVCEARRLADKLGVAVEGVAVGHDLDQELVDLGQYGCDKVYYVDDIKLEQFNSVPYSRVIADVITDVEPQIVLFGATTTGRDIAPRIASELSCGLTADCTELEIGDHKIKDTVYENTLLQNRPAFGGNIVATIVSPESSPIMSTVREGVMKLADLQEGRKAEVEVRKSTATDKDFMSEILESVRIEKDIDLAAEKIIVTAGMGACNEESLALVKELAEVLGGEVGATRPVADSGLLSRERQVGQTGITVRPTLYICCGVSGQIQHRAGMAESQRIIAINNDPDAPIFSIAHYGIVGDVNNVLKEMIKAYKV